MFEQLCRKITDFPELMTDFLPNQNPRYGLLGLQPILRGGFFWARYNVDIKEHLVKLLTSE